MQILNKDGKEIKTLDLGVVEAGKSKEFEYVLYNDSEVDVIDIKVDVDNKEVEVIKVPEKMYIKGKDSLILKWSPSLTIKKGLHTILKLTIVELYK